MADDPFADIEQPAGGGANSFAPREDLAPANLINAAAELGFLESLLADNRLIEHAADMCRPADFGVALYGHIYAAMLEQRAAGQSVDAVTLAPFCRTEEGWLEAFRVLSAAHLNAGTRGQTRSYFNQITMLSSRRRLVAGLMDVATSARNLNVSQAELISNADEAVAAVSEGSTEPSQAPVGAIAQIVIDSFGKPIVGVRCGVIGSLDDLMGVLRLSNFIVVGGRPGMGKTALVTSYSIGAAARGHGVLIFSLEMSADELTRRMLADMCFSVSGRVAYEKVRDGTVTGVDLERVIAAKERLDAMPIEICDQAGITLAALRRRVRSHKRRLAARGEKLELVIVDYLQLMAHSRPGMSMYEHASEISRGLKVLAKDEGLVVMAVAQLSRDVEKRPDKRPVPSDLRDSGQIEQDADVILFVYREEEYLKLSEPEDQESVKYEDWKRDMEAVRNKVEFLCPKRRSGPTGKAFGWFFGANAAVRGAEFYRASGGPQDG